MISVPKRSQLFVRLFLNSPITQLWVPELHVLVRMAPKRKMFPEKPSAILLLRNEGLAISKLVYKAEYFGRIGL